MNKTNIHTIKLIQELKKTSNKEKKNIWKALARYLEKSSRQIHEVNLSKIEKYAKEGETIVVPGKVLGVGEVNKKVTVAALQFSQKAKEKLKSTLTISELMKKNPKGQKVRILG